MFNAHTVLSSPTLLSVTPNSSTSLLITWSTYPQVLTDYTTVDRHEISYSPVVGASCSSLPSNVTTVLLAGEDVTDYLLEGLEENTTYAISIVALNGLGSSAASGVLEASTFVRGMT